MKITLVFDFVVFYCLINLKNIRLPLLYPAYNASKQNFFILELNKGTKCYDSGFGQDFVVPGLRITQGKPLFVYQFYFVEVGLG